MPSSRKSSPIINFAVKVMADSSIGIYACHIYTEINYIDLLTSNNYLNVSR